MGSGTVGRLTKWTGFTSSNSVIGDSTIYEDKYGLVGIGTDSPASKLTVNGMIQSLSGGLKFPDGTVQTSSATGALLSIAHDTTLEGNGTSSSPLAIRVPLFLSASSTDVFTARQNGGCTGCSAITGFAEGASIGVTGAVTAFVPVPRTGVQGVSDTGVGVLGQSKTDIGVRGEGSIIGVKGGGTGVGVSGLGGSRNNGFGGIGVIAQGGDGGGVGNRGGVGIYALGGLGTGGAIDGLAGFFFGNVQVSGTLSKGAGAFKIDHPLDPENKYLSHSFVESPDINALTPGVNATFEAWVFLANAPTEIASLFNKWNQTIDDEYLVGISPGRTLYFAWHTTGGNTWPSTAFNQAASTGTIPLNAWTHVAVVRSGAQLTFYINGIANTVLAVMDANPFRNGPATLRVGAQGRGVSRFFNGTIDEVRMYSRALTPSEIAADMGPGTGPDVTPPVISLTAPAQNATVSRLVTVSANATDNIGVAGVQFKLDGVNLGLEDALAPFTVLWDTTTSSPGPHTLTAVAFDAAGNQASSTPVAVTVSNNSQLTLAWDANVEPTLAGYKLYVGEASGVYGSTIDVGNVTSVTVTTLQAGHLYFFAVSAYDQAGVESGFSNEVSTSAP